MANTEPKRKLTLSQISDIASLFVLTSVFVGPYYKINSDAAAINNPEYRTQKTAVRGERNYLRNILANMPKKVNANVYTDSDHYRMLTSEEKANAKEILDTFEKAFEHDATFKSFPFNEKYLEEALDGSSPLLVPDVDARGWENTAAANYGTNGNRIVYNMNPAKNPCLNDINDRNGFGPQLAHELGHSMGLGESLTSLFAEIITGDNKVGSPGYLIGQNQASLPFNFVYSSAYDRILLVKVGEKSFWTAVLSGTDSYRKLWNDNMGDIVSFDDMQLVRAVFDAQFVHKNIKDLQAGNNITLVGPKSSMIITGKIDLIPAAFADAMNDKSPAQAKSKEQTKAFLSTIADFAKKNNVRPKHAVNDFELLKNNVSLSDKVRNMFIYPSRHQNEFLYIVLALSGFARLTNRYGKNKPQKKLLKR